MTAGKLNTAMILAAGLGTRLRPVTETIPKALVEIDGKPILELVLNKLISAGVQNIVINTHHFAGQVEEFISTRRFNANIKLTYEEKILGTGGGIKNAAEYLESSGFFLVHNVDVISDFSLADLYETYISKDAFAELAVQKRKTSRPLMFDSGFRLAGRVVDGNAEVFGDEEKLTEFAFSGVHLISSEIFRFFPVEDVFDIIPVYMSLAKSNHKICGFDIGNSKWKDIGKFGQ